MNIVVDLRPLIGGKTSGVEIFTRRLVENLISVGKAHTFILWVNASADQNEILSCFSGRNVVKIQTRIPNRLLNSMLFFLHRPLLDRLIFKKTGLKPDVFLLTDLRPSAFSRYVKKICVIHDLSFHHFPHFFRLKTRIWHNMLNAKKNIDKFDSIIAVSDFTKENLRGVYGIKQDKISVIHEGLPGYEQIIPNENIFMSVKRKYSLPDKYFLFLSTIEPRKNVQRMIDAFSVFKETDTDGLKLVISGTSNPKIFARQKIRTCDDIVFTGHVEEEDKPYLFYLAKAFIYPSIYEGFGLPLLEAMNSLTPIIASNTSSIPEICGKAAIYFSPFKTEQMTIAMHQVLHHAPREYLKEEMQKRIKSFSWKKCAEQTLQTIESCRLS